MEHSPSMRILAAWVELEGALRKALPSCSVAPPNQPSELLSALRINGRIGPDEEARIRALRTTRNRVAVAPDEPDAEEADRFEAEAGSLAAQIGSR